ncbi:hypothetical protein O6P43_024756 [Quillaja saponaria]|uniref:Uncharacterized protein n=1 Tax=Quillaja saponaria TaxID=32244 RepID=A0AAD7L914_QUISA|nr:hypothetical protein O6P43_024756 [Quillaja saponaria]
MELGGSFRLQRGSSLRLWRSHSSRFLSESITSECSRITRYERVSESVRPTNEYDFREAEGGRKRNNRAFEILSKVFTLRRISVQEEIKQRRPVAAAADKEEKKKKKRSSWLPDPDKRWPIQGW